MTNTDNTDVPSGKCAIKYSDNTFFKVEGNGEVKSGSVSSLSQNTYHFVVISIGNEQVNIFSDNKNKYLTLDGHHAKATGSYNCGDACKFTVEEIVSAPVSSSGILL